MYFNTNILLFELPLFLEFNGWACTGYSVLLFRDEGYGIRIVLHGSFLA